MSFGQWSERNASLNAFRTAIHCGTHGRLRDLALDLMDDDSVIVSGLSHSYHVIQLALQTTKQFGNAHRVFSKTRLLLRIGDQRLEFLVVHARHDNPVERLSTRIVDRHRQLTLVAR